MVPNETIKAVLLDAEIPGAPEPIRRYVEANTKIEIVDGRPRLRVEDASGAERLHPETADPMTARDLVAELSPARTAAGALPAYAAVEPSRLTPSETMMFIRAHGVTAHRMALLEEMHRKINGKP